MKNPEIESEDDDERGPLCTDECPREPHDHTLLDLSFPERWTDKDLADAEAAVALCKKARSG